MSAAAEFDLGPGLRLEVEIDAGEAQSIRARWQFGRWLLGHRVGKQLPNGLLDQLVEATGKSRSELKYRIQFAERFATEDEVANTLATCSWHEIVNTILPATTHISQNSGENEWYTPREYIDAARVVMGGIDLDPASTAVANDVVGATTFFTKEQDGLERDWRGRVWMNPPYARPLVDQFCERLTDAVRLGDVAEACVLVNNATETAWFHTLASEASALCFPRRRIHFWHPDRSAQPLQGQAVVYLGAHAARFRKGFAEFGFTAKL